MKNNNLPNNDLSFLLKGLENQNNVFSPSSSNFIMKDIPVRSFSESQNDKKIFQYATIINGYYLLDLNIYNKLSKQTRHELSKSTTMRGSYVSIDKFFLAL